MKWVIPAGIGFGILLPLFVVHRLIYKQERVHKEFAARYVLEPKRILDFRNAMQESMEFEQQREDELNKVIEMMPLDFQSVSCPARSLSELMTLVLVLFRDCARDPLLNAIGGRIPLKMTRRMEPLKFSSEPASARGEFFGVLSLVQKERCNV